MRTVEINNVTFELARDTRNIFEVINAFRYDGRTIYDCYARPSARKIGIYKAWEKWYNELDEKECDYSNCFGVTSYNCNFFSLGAIVKWQGKWYSLAITSAHNRAVELTF